MKYINTDESEKYDIKHGQPTESPLRGSTTRFICNPIVDDIEADEPNGRIRRWRADGRVFIDTTAPDGTVSYQPPKCLVVGGPSVNNLAAHRWHNGGLPDAETEANLIRRIQERDPRCRAGDKRGCQCSSCLAFFDPRKINLLPAFHRTVVDPAGKYIPGGGWFSRRKPKEEKHTNELLYEDLTSVGCWALWESTLKFDFERGHRFSTPSRHKIKSWISNEANYLRQGGYTSGDTVGRYLRATRFEARGKELPRRTATRVDRWIFSNLGAPPEELLKFQEKNLKRPVFDSLKEAAEAIKRANNLQHPEIYSDGGDDDVERDGYDTSKANRATEPLEEFRDVYDSHNPLKWSPQLGDSFTSSGRRFHHEARPWFVLAVAKEKLPGHRKVSAIVDFWIREFCDPPRIKAKTQPKPVYKPCTVKPTGRVLHPTETPYWMEPRDKRPVEKAGKPYDPDQREVAAVRFKNGKTKRVYRQLRAEPDRPEDVAWRAEYGATDWYSWMTSEQEKRKSNVRQNGKRGIEAPCVQRARVSRGSNGTRRTSRPQQHLVHLPPRIGQRPAGTRPARIQGRITFRE